MNDADASSAAPPIWRTDPYVVLFPLGALLAWAGLLPWLVFALGWSTRYASIHHSITQVEGFMTCFAVGFLFTAIPRRTGTPGPAAWQMIVAVAAPVLTTAGAWMEEFAWSQLAWLVLAGTVVEFVVRRFRSSNAARRPPVSFVWVPVSFVMGIVGVCLIAAYGMMGLDFRWHQLGRLLVLQGMFLGLVLGVGGMLLPLITRRASSVDAHAGSGPALVGHVVAILALLASFMIDAFATEHRTAALRTAFALRAVVVLAVLVAGCRIHRWPNVPGAHRWLVWAAAWALPIGYALAAWRPELAQAGLHVVFISGFGLMALTVGAHVILAHNDAPELVFGTAWQVPILGACVLAATVARVLVLFDSVHARLWLGLASGAFLLATLFWALLVIRPFLGNRGSSKPPPTTSGLLRVGGAPRG